MRFGGRMDAIARAHMSDVGADSMGEYLENEDLTLELVGEYSIEDVLGPI